MLFRSCGGGGVCYGGGYCCGFWVVLELVVDCVMKVLFSFWDVFVLVFKCFVVWVLEEGVFLVMCGNFFFFVLFFVIVEVDLVMVVVLLDCFFVECFVGIFV